MSKEMTMQGKEGRLRKVLGRECGREVWQVISLLNRKHQVMLYDAVIDYVDYGEVTGFGSVVMQRLYDYIVDVIDERGNR